MLGRRNKTSVFKVRENVHAQGLIYHFTTRTTKLHLGGPFGSEYFIPKNFLLHTQVLPVLTLLQVAKTLYVVHSRDVTLPPTSSFRFEQENKTNWTSHNVETLLKRTGLSFFPYLT